jgi:hypothetical protein
MHIAEGFLPAVMSTCDVDLALPRDVNGLLAALPERPEVPA